MRRWSCSIPAALVSLFLVLVPGPVAGAHERLPTIADKTRGLATRPGFLPLYWDGGEGKLWLEIPRLDEELIYVVSLATGFGSNDIGLDRSQLGRERIVRFQRVGPKVLMVEPNYRFRADSPSPDERRAVEESFARSVLWGFKIEAETGERVLVDVTEFALRDAHDAIGTLRETQQGDFKLDVSRSAIYLPRTQAFPKNSEIEVELTFTSDRPGPWVRDVAPTAESITARQRHSFVALPEPGYRPRASDPRAGYFGISYLDYAAPIGAPIAKRFIARHRLQKKDPGVAVSEALEPIVYYLDRGVPEPIRSALLDGARWWSEAFEAAGFRNAYRVELLPEGSDPLDARYHVIQWVHRATRGWSYGASVVDPRTGEILKGHVLLGSLRVRQDYLLAEGLLAPYETGDESPAEPREMALARLRQLAAHEVGHTLGLAHNYIASVRGRASVMDYPHPLIRLGPDGIPDLSDAYATGVGAWDRVAIDYGYREFSEGVDEKAALDRILAQARERGMEFITDQDARPAGGLHPQAHLWDNGADAVAELSRVMKVRRVALDRFGERTIQRGMPLATMEEALVPLYLHHRYQTEAAVKVLGGKQYTYALRGDAQQPLRPVPPTEQRRALATLLRTLDPAELAMPRSVLESLPPRPYTYPAHRELFGRTTGLSFDAVAPAEVAARMVVGLMLQPERAARLIEQHSLDPALPGLESVIDRLVAATFGGKFRDPYHATLARAVERVVVEELMRLAEGARGSAVRSVATWKLAELRRRIGQAARRGDPAYRAHDFLVTADIERFLERGYDSGRRSQPIEPPPGSPIGEEPSW